MIIDAKMFNEKEKTCIPYTMSIVKAVYGSDITPLIFNTKKKTNIFKQINVSSNEIFKIFENFYDKYSEDSIVYYLLNKSDKAGEVRKDLYETLFSPDNSNKYELSEYNELINSFKIFCLCKLDANKKYTDKFYTKKDIIDYYSKFWYNLFNNIDTINQLSELTNDPYFILRNGEFVVEVNNMFGVKDNSFVLKPNTFNFIHLNIEKIRNKIAESMKFQYNIMPKDYVINLRTFIEEPHGIIDKVVFHNLNQTEKNDKTLNIVWNERKVNDLVKDIRNGKEFYIKNKDSNEITSLSKLIKKLSSEEVQTKKFSDKYTLYDKIIEQWDCAKYYLEGYTNSLELDNNHCLNRIFIELDNDLEGIKHIYYPVEFDVSFDIYKKITNSNKVKYPSLPDFIAGKIHFCCLVDFNEYDNYSFLNKFCSYKLKKDKSNSKSYEEVMTETLKSEYSRN